ncbi:MAG TPA: hypothetical protein PLT23_02500, partial [Lentisphaeria bacterium]|nr:hypothetical protein [Lentisphaeria bacterium]
MPEREFAAQNQAVGAVPGDCVPQGAGAVNQSADVKAHIRTSQSQASLDFRRSSALDDIAVNWSCSRKSIVSTEAVRRGL